MYLNLIQNLMFFSPFEQFDSVTWVILDSFCVMFFCIFSMSLYVALALYPLVAVISNHLDTYPTPINLSYMWSFGSIAGRINPKLLFSAALVVAPTQTPTFVENVGIWVDDHPIVTVVVISSIIFLGGIAITYFVAPHLLGITVAGAAGAVDPLKQLTTQLADAKSEVIVQQGLRVAAEARLGEVSADLDTERVLRFAVQAQANLVNAHTEAAVDAMGVRLREANASVSGLQLQLTQARSLNDTIGVRDSGKQGYLTDLLGKIRLEEVKPSVKMVGGKPILNLSGNCRDFIADHVMDSAQVAHNVIKGTPLQQPLPADVAAKLGANIDPVLNSLLTELIRAMFG